MNNNSSTIADISKLTAVVLAGGLGTRLRPLIKDRQKVMAQVADKPFLEHILTRLDEQGIQRAVLCTGYMAQQVEEYFGDRFGDIELVYSEEQLLLGTGGAIRFALNLVKSDPLIALNGDSFCDANLLEFYAAHLERKATASMLLVEVDDTRRYGRVDFNSQNKIVKFEEKGATTGPGWINAGIYLIAKQIIEDLPKGHNISLEREVFAQLVGQEFYAHCGKVTKFIDIGIPESIERAQSVMREPKVTTQNRETL